MSDWRDISTAPKDGTRIMVWNSFAGVYSSAYLNGEWPLYGWGNEGVWYPRPTHWMPLPDAPVSA